MTITWWFLMNILIFEPVMSFDIIQILDYLIFGSSTHRKILLDIDAQQKFILEQESIKKNIQSLQRDIDKINWNIEKWKDYNQNSNIIIYLVASWIIGTLNNRVVERNERLNALRSRQISEPFCDQYHLSGTYHEHYNSICIKAFEDKFFHTKKWTLSTRESRDNTSCLNIDIYKIEKPSQPTEHHKIVQNRWVRRCAAQHTETHSHFNIYLISSINYKPDSNTFSYYVVIENNFRERSKNDGSGGILHNLLPNYNSRKEIAAYIEK